MYPEPVKFLEPLPGRSLVLILTIMQLDFTLEFLSFYPIYTSVVIGSLCLCVISVKVIVCVCKDGVKVNYSLLILSQREP